MVLFDNIFSTYNDGAGPNKTTNSQENFKKRVVSFKHSQLRITYHKVILKKDSKRTKIFHDLPRNKIPFFVRFLLGFLWTLS